MSDRVCKNCVHRWEDNRCHRFPPTAVIEPNLRVHKVDYFSVSWPWAAFKHSAFPKVKNSDGCAEFKKRKDEVIADG